MLKSLTHQKKKKKKMNCLIFQYFYIFFYLVMRSDKRPLTFVQTASYCQISISMYDVRFHAPIV